MYTVHTQPGPGKPFKLMWGAAWAEEKCHKTRKNGISLNIKSRAFRLRSIVVHEGMNVAQYINTWCSPAQYKPHQTTPTHWHTPYTPGEPQKKGIYYLWVCILTKQKLNCCFWLFAICACTWLFDDCQQFAFFPIRHTPFGVWRLAFPIFAVYL